MPRLSGKLKIPLISSNMVKLGLTSRIVAYGELNQYIVPWVYGRTNSISLRGLMGCWG